MRKVALCSLFLLAGCPGLGEVAFDVPSSGQSTVNGAPGGGLLPSLSGFGGFDNMTFSQSQAFRNSNTDKDHIRNAYVTRFTLKVVSPPSGQDLSFLTSIEFKIQTPSFPSVKIASIGAIQPGVTTVDLDLTNADIAQYAKADSFSITTTATGHQPAQNTTIEADLTLHIVASVL